MNSKVTLLSNLIDKANSIDLDKVEFVPQIGFETEIASSDKFSLSRIFCEYTPELPNRPYTFSQSFSLLRRASQLIRDVNALLVEVGSFVPELTDPETVVRFRAHVVDTS